MDKVCENKNTSLFDSFNKYSITEIQDFVYTAKTREEQIFFVNLLNLKMTFAQEKIVGKELI